MDTPKWSVTPCTQRLSRQRKELPFSFQVSGILALPWPGRKHPYIVVPLRFNQFYDLQKVAKENYGSFKQTTDGERVNWGKIKIIKIDTKKGTYCYV